MKSGVSSLAMCLAVGFLAAPITDADARRLRRPPPPPTSTVTHSGLLHEQLYETDGSAKSLRTSSGPATIGYDTLTQSYTVRETNGTQFTFSASEIVGSESTAAFTLYRDTGSGVAFRLLNQGSTNPLIDLSYVRYGTWNRAVTPSAGYTSAHKQDWMVFGPMTPNASIPRTGTATYAAIIDGNYYDQNGSYTLSGSAGLTADFATGGLSMFINPQGTNVANGSVVSFGGFRGAGTIDYATGIFSGSDSSANYIFSYRGNFYGPAANEVGGSFGLNTIPALGGGMGGGIFVGKQGSLPAAQPEPVPPPPPPATGPATLSIERTWTGTGAQTSSPAGATITYDSASGTYVVKERDSTSFTFTSDEKLAAESTAAVSAYRDAASGTTFRQLNAGDPSVALTYVSYGSWRRPVIVNGAPAEKIIHVVYGSPTLVSAMPRSGSATYNARLDGTMTSASGLHALGGSAQFVADFAAGTMGYTLRPVASVSGQNAEFGPVSGSATISGASFNGRGTSTSPYYFSAVSGGFFGPTAQEIGGVFNFSGSSTSGPSLTGSGAGAFVGKQ